MSGPIGRDVLALDEQLCAEDFLAAEAAARGAMPAAALGLVDQFGAAARETTHLAVLRALLGPAASEHRAIYRDLPGWLRLGMVEALTRAVAGEALTCAHTGTGAIPIVAVAWRPGAYTCRACQPLLFPEPGTDADRTCDGCARICADGVRITSHLLGPMTFYAGLCPDCHGDLASAKTPARRTLRQEPYT